VLTTGESLHCEQAAIGFHRLADSLAEFRLRAPERDVAMVPLAGPTRGYWGHACPVRRW